MYIVHQQHKNTTRTRRTYSWAVRQGIRGFKDEIAWEGLLRPVGGVGGAGGVGHVVDGQGGQVVLVHSLQVKTVLHLKKSNIVIEEKERSEAKGCWSGYLLKHKNIKCKTRYIFLSITYNTAK